MSQPDPPASGLGAIREQHTRGHFMGVAHFPIVCKQCRKDWPCDAALLLEQLDAQAARLANAAEMGKVLDALRADLAAARNALVVLYELNEAGNVGGAVYEEAMDLAMDVLRDTETAAGAVGAGEARDGE